MKSTLGGVVGTVADSSFSPARAAIAALLVALGALLALGASPAFAQPPYEPNDSLLTAYGPLANNSTYQAALETENDLDYYYFYVTTLSSAQLTFTITNLGGAPESRLDAYLTDSHGGFITDLARYLKEADYSTKSVTLGAGKYYVEIKNNERYGETYKVTTSGTEGAFGEYSAIQAQCAAATTPVVTYQAQVATAETNLRKAEARFHRVYNHPSTRRARRRARAKLSHVKATLAAEKASLKTAEAGQKPWCFIPQ